MKFNAGAFDKDSNTVPVTFTHNGVKHDRSVNACLDDKGAYDAKATKARIEQVANGVAAKIERGVITNA